MKYGKPFCLTCFLLILCMILPFPAHAESLLVPDEPESQQSEELLGRDLSFLGVYSGIPKNSIRGLKSGTLHTGISFRSDFTLKISWKKEDGIRKAYLRFRSVPESYTLICIDESGTVLDTITVEGGLPATVIPFPEGCVGILFSVSNYCSMSSFRLYGEGNLPFDVMDWQQNTEKTDLMVIAAHPDDELLYMGCLFPLYTGLQQKNTSVVYMTCSLEMRKWEALQGIWTTGMHNMPIFLNLEDGKPARLGLESAAKVWDCDAVVEMLVSLIRQQKPEVVATHGLDGEYGHGGHMLTAKLVSEAVIAAQDPDMFPESAEQFGTWSAKKLYLHEQAEDDMVTLAMDEPLAMYDGLTAFEVAKRAFSYHESQQKGWGFGIRKVADYPMNLWHLVSTTVGPDILKDDLFEHVSSESDSEGS